MSPLFARTTTLNLPHLEGVNGFGGIDNPVVSERGWRNAKYYNVSKTMIDELEKDEIKIDPKAWFDKYLNVSWKIALPFCTFAIGCGIFMFWYTQNSCDTVYDLPLMPDTPMENSPLRYNCTQLQYDYACCRVKRAGMFWKNTCIIEYQPTFMTQCVNMNLLDIDSGFLLIVHDEDGNVIRDDTKTNFWK